ncbi:nucleotidyltransferase family protein [uncultured Sulfitobacter sp.]|uniref:nucleotidyltransferase family protein n=1 Tax=uncultured Sulfitobacter sp. TaxID=191468 RepID=UPI0026135067|nr:nucleotidyltransferase family protein [uncultured Sulfitobacter sp.]
MSDVAVLILAAGASRRMQGRDKLLEEIDGTPLLRRQTLRALGLGCEVLVALPSAPHPRYDALAGLDVVVVPVADAAEGMNASLRAGLAALPAQTKAVMLLLADMPDLTQDDLQTVLQAVDVKTDTLIWRATTSGGAMGHPVVFRASLFDDLKSLSGDSGASDVVKTYAMQTQLVALPANHARTDLDTPEAWENWRAARRPT